VSNLLLMWGICFWCEQFEFDVSNLFLMWAIWIWCEQFVFDVSNLFLMWAICFWFDSCGPPYYPHYTGEIWKQSLFLHLGLQFTVTKMELFKMLQTRGIWKHPRDCCFTKFLRCRMERKHLMHFQSETYVFEFLRHSVDRALSCSYCWLKQLYLLF